MIARKTWIVLSFMVLVVVSISFAPPVRNYFNWIGRRMTGGATVEQRLVQYGPAARSRLSPHFQQAGIPYPPEAVALIGIKDRKVLQVWATDQQNVFRQVCTYPILGASGVLGPKLREGDRQVPEGIYEIQSLHPNSLYHLALRVNYPNQFDCRMGMEDGRDNLGGDIMIHGSTGSVGCLAMGNRAIEELFVLAGDVGAANVSLILTPVDFRESSMPAEVKAKLPPWTNELYEEIEKQLAKFPLPPN